MSVSVSTERGQRNSPPVACWLLLPGPAELTGALACLPSLSRHSGGDAGQWSPLAAPPTALGARGHLPLGVAEMMSASWPPHPAPGTPKCPHRTKD